MSDPPSSFHLGLLRPLQPVDQLPGASDGDWQDAALTGGEKSVARSQKPACQPPELVDHRPTAVAGPVVLGRGGWRAWWLSCGSRAGRTGPQAAWNAVRRSSTLGTSLHWATRVAKDRLSPPSVRDGSLRRQIDTTMSLRIDSSTTWKNARAVSES